MWERQVDSESVAQRGQAVEETVGLLFRETDGSRDRQRK